MSTETQKKDNMRLGRERGGDHPTNGSELMGSTAQSARAMTAKKASAGALSDEATPIIIPEGYAPSDDEEFMNERQRAYFRGKLLEWKQSLLEESKETVAALQEVTLNVPDLTDRAAEESDRRLELRTRDRQRKLIGKIDAALRRIDDGTYGYCEMTGEPIGLRRLAARPIATLSIEAQEMHERSEKVHRDD